jgi:hypothetical protein
MLTLLSDGNKSLDRRHPIYHSQAQARIFAATVEATRLTGGVEFAPIIPVDGDVQHVLVVVKSGLCAIACDNL